MTPLEMSRGTSGNAAAHPENTTGSRSRFNSRPGFTNPGVRPGQTKPNQDGDETLGQRPNTRPSTSRHTSNPTEIMRIIPMGGLTGVGEKNMTVVEYGDDLLVIDMGLQFADETTPGVDYIIPDTFWLEENKHRIRGVVFTHAHLDHIGSVQHVLPKLGWPPVYTLPLTAGLIKKRLDEHGLTSRLKVHAITPDDVLPFGNIKVEMFRVNHNIPDGVGLYITTPAGSLIYCTDWKIDHTPADGKRTEFHKIAKFAGQGVDILMSDSTNAIKPGYCMSERELGKNIAALFANAKGRIIFATFSSLIARMQQVLDAAAAQNRKVAFNGRSMLANVEIAISLGYLKVLPQQVISVEDVSKYPDNRVVVVTTGAQGEESSGLTRMATGDHRNIRIKPGDTVVLSSSPIPGNERSVAELLSNLTREGAKVIYNKVLDIHTSGHAHQEELKFMLNLVNPRYFAPIHGEHFMLTAHAELAESMGISPERIFVLENGQGLTLNKQGEADVLNAENYSGDLFVDGAGVGDVGDVVIRDRQVMANDGMLVVIITMDRKTGNLIRNPEILSRGFTYMKGNDELLTELQHELRKVVPSRPSDPKSEPQFAVIKQAIRDHVSQFVFKKLKRNPMILPVVIEV